MAPERIQIEITNSPDLRRTAEAVRQTGRPCLQTESGEAVAGFMPLARKEASPRKRRRQSGMLRADELPFQLIGVGESGHSDVSSNKRKNLTETVP